MTSLTMTTENYVIDSWMNMHTLLASRPNVVALDALGLNGALTCTNKNIGFNEGHCELRGYAPLLCSEPVAGRRTDWVHH